MGPTLRLPIAAALLIAAATTTATARAHHHHHHHHGDGDGEGESCLRWEEMVAESPDAGLQPDADATIDDAGWDVGVAADAADGGVAPVDAGADAEAGIDAGESPLVWTMRSCVPTPANPRCRCVEHGGFACTIAPANDGTAPVAIALAGVAAIAVARRIRLLRIRRPSRT